MISKWVAGATGAAAFAVGLQVPPLFEPGPAVEIQAIELDKVQQLVTLSMLVRRSSTVEWTLTLAESPAVTVPSLEDAGISSNRVIFECSQSDVADVVRLVPASGIWDYFFDRGVIQETTFPLEELFDDGPSGCQDQLEAGELYTASMSIETAEGETTVKRVAHIRAKGTEDEN